MKPIAILLLSLILTACGAGQNPPAGVAEPVAGPLPAAAEEPTGGESAAVDQDDCIDPAKVDPMRVCTMDYRPVCGCDGKTYGNACGAGGAGVTRWVEGECP